MEFEEDDPDKKRDLVKQVKEDNVRFMEMQFSDILGTVKSVSIPVTKLEKALDEGVFIDGSSILGYTTVEESDMRAMPIIDSYQVYPWTMHGEMRTARLMCTISDPTVEDEKGNRFPGDPRLALEKVMKKAEEKGWNMNVGPEFEFFLFKTEGDLTPSRKPSDIGGYFDLMPLDKGEMVRKDIMIKFDEMGFDVEESHHEVAPGQQEIDLKYGDALTIADRMMTMKLGIKTIAMQHGLHATFMPKPLQDHWGSAMHVHQSMVDNKGRNIFDDENGEHGLSDTALKYIGGLLKHAKATCAVLTPSINSYKRLIPGYEAPCYISWANMNRSALVRVPAGRGIKTRVEHRNPDPSGNPYLQFAVMLAAGLDGIEKGIYPGDPVEKDTFAMTKKERGELGLDCIPENLGEALDEMRESSMMKAALGDHMFEHFLHIKEMEWMDYRKQVTPWEIKKYLLTT
ncbi:MAG: type I glutamate--ammonia ligase [Methanomassiliicoccales archaeon]